jgi:hypothetical protein
MKEYAMAKKSANATNETLSTLGEDFQATRTVWNEGIDAMAPAAQDFFAQIAQLGKELYASPLGKRAQRNPVAAIGIASLALIACRKLLRL